MSDNAENIRLTNEAIIKLLAGNTKVAFKRFNIETWEFPENITSYLDINKVVPLHIVTTKSYIDFWHIIPAE